MKTESQTSDSVHFAAGGEQAASVQPRRLIAGGSNQAALLFAALAAMTSWKGIANEESAPRKSRKPVPRMVCSPAEEIAAWNAAVDKRSTRRARILMRRERAA